MVVVAPAPSAATAQEQQSEISCAVEYVPMRDGVRLATEVYRPPGAGPHPVVLSRSPYNRGFVDPDGTNCDEATAMVFAEAGYVALNQDVRGRYRSEGVFEPMVHEAQDGYDMVEWAAAQPWSTGKVGMYGTSYVGITQWQAGIDTPPHLEAMVPHNIGSDYHDNFIYTNGVLNLWLAQSWNLSSLVPENFRRSLLASGVPPDEAEQRVAAWSAAGRESILTDWVRRLPLRSLPAFRGDKAPWYYDWLRHPTYDRYWERLDVEPRYRQVEVPTLNTGGWYDVFNAGTVRNFQGMQENGGTPEAREGAKLVMRPHVHIPNPGTPPTTVGDIEFGPGNAFDVTAAAVRFFDHHLKGLDNGVDEDPAVRLFVMIPPDQGTSGSGFWVTGDSFPLPGTKARSFLLDSDGNANTSAGDGALNEGRERSEGGAGSHSFVYDPLDPSRRSAGTCAA